MNTALDILTKNRHHNITGPEVTFPIWGTRYLEEEVIGIQSSNTADAKRRDLQCFMEWYVSTTGHLDISEWMRRDTASFVDHLQREGRATATINRILATLRHFARWLLDREDCPLKLGSPVKGINALAIDEAPAQALSNVDLNALFRAAEKLAIAGGRKNGRPIRNRAILSVLYFSGLRVSELCNLKLDQYTGTHLINIVRKGKARTKSFYLNVDCRKMIDEYLDKERPIDAKNGPWLFLSVSSSKPLNRQSVTKVLKHIAEEASAHRQNPIRVHPHQFRHTFGTKVRKTTGSDAETAALLGHSSTRYVGIYARGTEEERESTLESLSQI